MTRIAFDRNEDLLASNLQQVRHREAYLQSLLDHLDKTPLQEPERYRDYDGWYLGVLEDGLLRRALAVEYQEWARHVQDLLCDQLSRNGYDSDCWEEIRQAPGEASLVARVRRALSELLDSELPEAVWAALEELAAVAETIRAATPEARAALAARYPAYFSALDAFGDGDETGRLTLRPEHLARAFGAVSRFWDPQQGLPHRLVDGAA